MAIFRSTTYQECTDQPASPVEDVDANGNWKATRTILVNWTDRQQAIMDFLGYSYTTEVQGQKYVARITPHAHPDWADEDATDDLNFWTEQELDYYQAIDTNVLYAASAHIEGIGIYGDYGDSQKSGADVALYNQAKITLEYCSLSYSIVDDATLASAADVGWPDESTLLRYVTKEVEPAAEYLTLPNGKFYWATTSGPKPIPVPGEPPKLTPNYDLSYTWHQIPTRAIGTGLINPGLSYQEVSSWGPIDYMLGRVNSVTFDGANPGTLLLVGAKLIRRGRDASGSRVWDVQYHIKVLPTPLNGNTSGTPFGGHNLLLQYQTSGSAYTEVSIDGKSYSLTVDSKHIFDAGDFHDLFKVF